ncbi:MAG: hypothetical protein OEW67_14600 [Cyclobacteriaceae bacterium]|nr:hypothetical protein [Cyclobacteriaceae bacterium]
MKKGVFTMMFFFCIVTVGSVVTLSGCDDCRGVESYNTRIASLENGLLEMIPVFDANNVFQYFDTETLPTGITSLTFDSVGFEIHLIPQIISTHVSGEFSIGFTQNYACEPPLIIEQPIGIQITSNSDYDQNHKAGSSLNDIFLAIPAGSSRTISIDDFILEKDKGYRSVFIINVAPDLQRNHIITFTITLEDGKELIAVFDEITIRQ